MTANKPTLSNSPAGDGGLKLPPPEEYAKFIQGIELLDVRLVSSHATSNAIRPDASELRLRVRYRSDITRLHNAGTYVFEAYPRLKVIASKAEGEDPAGEVEVRLGLRYESKLEPTDGFLEIFSQVNLQVNAWPYLREYVQQTITRFGWTPLVLPTLKTAPTRPPRTEQTR